VSPPGRSGDESSLSDPSSDPRVDFLRHTLATLVYRGAKAVRDAPEGFADFRVGPTSRTPGQILAHMGDVLEWAGWLLRGEHRWREAEPLPWPEESARFFRLAAELDGALGSVRASSWSLERIFQGPIADALTHVGQINMLRRLAGSPVRGENYAKAEITTGHLGAAQADPRVEFD
jgi:hypothetical protein